jgi:hypothetical protein
MNRRAFAGKVISKGSIREKNSFYLVREILIRSERVTRTVQTDTETIADYLSHMTLNRSMGHVVPFETMSRDQNFKDDTIPIRPELE